MPDCRLTGSESWNIIRQTCKKVKVTSVIKTRTWIIIIAVLLVLLSGIQLWISFKPKTGTYANIYLDGDCIRSINLEEVTEPYEFLIETPEGNNRVRVEHGRIRIVEADCHDGVCVKFGWLSEGVTPIVCLPHRLVIRMEAKTGTADGDDNGIDAVTK